MIEVCFDQAEVIRAALVGVGRQARRLQKGSQHRHGLKPDTYRDWGRHIGSAAAEMAYCKAMDCYWHPSLEPDDFDVQDAQIRHTLGSPPRLPVRPGDHGRCVLVTGRMPRYWIAGQIMAEDARQEQWWQPPGDGRPGCWLVPQDQLLPVEKTQEEWW